MNDWFRVRRLICENDAAGLEHTTFRGLRHFKLMTLSPEALRILILPNAGGNSIVSEVLSYEVLRGCFRAQLLKVTAEVSLLGKKRKGKRKEERQKKREGEEETERKREERDT